MKQGRVLRVLSMVLAAGAIAACQVVSGLSSLSEPEDLTDAAAADGARPGDAAGGDGAARDGGTDALPEAGASRSCIGLGPSCATYDELDGAVVGDKESCCARRDVPGGTTSREFDYYPDGGLAESGAPATISKLALDRFEVTVGRFKKFLDAYEGGWHPAPGSGAGLRLAGDKGWTFDTALPPGVALRAAVAACDESSLGFDERSPINCITYAEALAFCIFDGGRLPTEAEWSFAAAGGAELRVQPFSVPPSMLLYQADLFQANANGTALVGLHPGGDGKFHHADLLGNVAEWVRDAYVTPYPGGACNDCLVDAPDAARSVRGSGFDVSTSSAMPRTTRRDSLDPAMRLWDVGVRCAYDLP